MPQSDGFHRSGQSTGHISAQNSDGCWSQGEEDVTGNPDHRAAVAGDGGTGNNGDGEGWLEFWYVSHSDQVLGGFGSTLLTRSNRVNSVNRVSRSATVNDYGLGSIQRSCGSRFWFRVGLTRSNQVNSVNGSQRPVNSVHGSTQEIWNTLECTLASRALETTSRSRKLASFAQEYSGYFSNNGTVGIGGP
ncbi:hypothetical protein Hdeb2414_s0002g00061831 [Helianthus debilis subsp. tardiflorus]